jgi:hypothetical protein
MSHEYFHGSPDEISEIRDSGTFGGIFASPSAASARSHGPVLHIVRSPRPLTNYALNYEIDGAYDVALDIAGGDERIADAIMTAECAALDDCEPCEAGEQSWEFQRLRGVLAARLGYTSVEMRDEHGTTWLCLPGCEITVLEG